MHGAGITESISHSSVAEQLAKSDGHSAVGVAIVVARGHGHGLACVCDYRPRHQTYLADAFHLCGHDRGEAEGTC